jgi:hypothetical protein
MAFRFTYEIKSNFLDIEYVLAASNSRSTRSKSEPHSASSSQGESRALSDSQEWIISGI